MFSLSLSKEKKKKKEKEERREEKRRERFMTGFEAIEPIPPPFGVTFKGSGFCGPIPCILDRFDSEWMEEDRG